MHAYQHDVSGIMMWAARYGTAVAVLVVACEVMWAKMMSMSLHPARGDGVRRAARVRRHRRPNQPCKVVMFG